MAEISLKGLLMDKGETADRWGGKLLHHYDALVGIMRGAAAQFEAECGSNPYLALAFTRKAVSAFTVAGETINYRPDIQWRLKSPGAKVCGLGDWVTVEPFYDRHENAPERLQKAGLLADRMLKDLPATWERLRVYEVIKQRLRSEASLVYRTLQRLDELEETSAWMTLDGHHATIQAARDKLLQLRSQAKVAPAAWGV